MDFYWLCLLSSGARLESLSGHFPGEVKSRLGQAI